MKKLFTLLLLSFVTVAGFSQSTTVTISQVYAGGGTSTAGVTYKYDYVELHNISNVTQSLTGIHCNMVLPPATWAAVQHRYMASRRELRSRREVTLLIQMGAAGGAGADLPVTLIIFQLM